jgi:flagellar export protein FliJ
MAGFKFRLQSALRLRHLKTEAERARLQEMMAQQKRLENSLAALWRERDEAAAFVRSVDQPVAHDLRALSLFSIGVQNRARALEEGIEQLGAHINEQKQRLLVAERDERSLSKLRDKRFAEWNAKVMREIEATAQELWLATHTTSREDPEG